MGGLFGPAHHRGLIRRVRSGAWGLTAAHCAPGGVSLPPSRLSMLSSHVSACLPHVLSGVRWGGGFVVGGGALLTSGRLSSGYNFPTSSDRTPKMCIHLQIDWRQISENVLDPLVGGLFLIGTDL